LYLMDYLTFQVLRVFFADASGKFLFIYFSSICKIAPSNSSYD